MGILPLAVFRQSSYHMSSSFGSRTVKMPKVHGIIYISLVSYWTLSSLFCDS